jgi:hypothetical protein
VLHDLLVRPPVAERRDDRCPLQYRSRLDRLATEAGSEAGRRLLVGAVK